MLMRTMSPSLFLLCACASLPPRPVPLPEHTPVRPAWYPEPAWNKLGEAERVYLEGKVIFDTGKAIIRPEAEKVLNDLLVYLNANPDITRIRVEGHTDSRAGVDYNQKLSQRRVMAVADWLVDHGVDHERIIAVAFGKTRPLWPNISRAAMAENRRAEFHIAEISGNRFRGEDPTAGGIAIYVKSEEEREADKHKGVVPTLKLVVKVEGNVIKPVSAPKKLRDPLDEPEPPAPPPPPSAPSQKLPKKPGPASSSGGSSSGA